MGEPHEGKFFFGGGAVGLGREEGVLSVMRARGTDITHQLWERKE